MTTNQAIKMRDEIWDAALIRNVDEDTIDEAWDKASEHKNPSDAIEEFQRLLD